MLAKSSRFSPTKLNIMNNWVLLSKLLALASVSCTMTVALPEIKGDTQPAPRTERWEQTIGEFEKSDLMNPPPRGAVLLVGGSNARRWQKMGDHFPEVHVINRGFGGARLTEVLHFADRIIFPYAPKLVIINAGGNDLNAGSTLAQIRVTAEKLVVSLRSELPDTRIYFIGLPYIGRASGNPEAQATIDGFNEQLAELAKNEPMVEYLDLVRPFLGEEGSLRPELFVKDGTHFSQMGYAVVAQVIKDKM